MVDPASGSQQQQQQQQPPTLSITVVPLNVVENPLSGGQELDGDEEEAGGYLLHPLSETAIVEASQSFYEDIVDDVILGIVFEVHRGAKLGLTALLEDGLTGTHGDSTLSNTEIIRFQFLFYFSSSFWMSEIDDFHVLTQTNSSVTW